MSNESSKHGADDFPVERRIIQVDHLRDQAGITAALRRAFSERPTSPCLDDDDPFAALLKRIH